MVKREPVPMLTSTSVQFLEALTIDHGPVAMLGRLFLKALAELSTRGLELEYLSPSGLRTVNEHNRDSWLPLLPTFDSDFSRLDTSNFVAIGVRDREGRIVGTHAVRLFDWRETDFGQELTSLRLFYADPEAMRLASETCRVTAVSAANISGRVAFSGAAWYHPDVRRHGLSHTVPRLGKALALAKWDIGRVVGIMSEQIYQRGFAPRFGYHGVDWDMTLSNSRVGTIRFALIWIDRIHLEAYLENYVGRGHEVDAGVLARDIQQAVVRPHAKR